MNTQPIDYKYSLELLSRINRLIENNKLLSNFFIYEGYNILQANQGALFSEIKIWSKNRSQSFLYPHNPFVVKIKILFISLFLILISIISALYFLITQKKVLIFSVDKVEGLYKNDFRLDSLYQALIQEQKNYIEIIHTVPGRGTIKNFFRRRRPVFFLETLDAISFFNTWIFKKRILKEIQNIDLSSFENEEKVFIQSLLNKYISSVHIFKQRHIFLKFFIKLIGVRQIFAIDDVRHYNEIMLAAKELGINSYAIQHGHYTKYHTGWLGMTKLKGKIIKPFKLIVWSDYWKEELLKLGTYFDSDDIVVGGVTNNKVSPVINQIVTKKIIVFPYETDAPKEEIKLAIEKILSDTEYQINFKIRRDIDINDQVREYGLQEKARFKIVSSIEDILPEIKLVIGTYSTYLYECVEKLIPVAIIKTPLDYGEGMIRNNLAGEVHVESIKEDIQKAANIPPEVLLDRKNRLVGQKPELIRDYIKEILSNV